MIETWVAPTVVTVVGILVAFYIGDRAAQASVRRRRRAYFSAKSPQGGWQGMIYDVRDWADMITRVVREGDPLPVRHVYVRCPGVETLRHLLRADELPRSMRPHALVLLEYASILRELVIRSFTSDSRRPAPGSPAMKRLEEVADAVATLANDLVHRPELATAARRELGIEPRLHERAKRQAHRKRGPRR